MSRLPDERDTLDTLPLKRIAGGTYYRVSKKEYASPIFYSRSLESRWTATGSEVGTLYLAEGEKGAIAESVCRNAADKPEEMCFSTMDELDETEMFEVSLQGESNVLDLTYGDLIRYRLDGRLTSEYSSSFPHYQWCQEWADIAVELGLAGILYPARQAPQQHCLALFEDRALSVRTHRRSYTVSDPRALRILLKDFNWAIP